MLKFDYSLKSHAAADEKVVVLLLPDVLGASTDPAQLRATLVDPAKAVRVLLCLTDSTGHALATTLADLGIEAEILLGPGVDAPVTKSFVLRAPLGTSSTDQIEFALALSDVVLVASASEQSPLIRTATELRKPVIVSGDRLPAIPPLASVSDRLDPDLPGWHACGRSFFGRFEQAVMELLAFNWLGRKEGVAESSKRLWKCFGREWRPGAYFAPSHWPELAPDRTARDKSSRIVTVFDAMDRGALHGSYIHRDLAWFERLGAAFAVFAAVAGQLSHNLAAATGELSHSKGWGVAELVTLLLVAFMVIWARRTRLQDRWTACRLGAEQLRIARMSLPLFVLPPALATADAPPAGDDHTSREPELDFSAPATANAPPARDGRTSKQPELDFLALAQVKRVVRDHGLPRLDTDFTPVQAAAWLHLIVKDQIGYHRSNHRKLDRAERRLRRVTQVIFLTAILAVVADLIHYTDWLLLLTAAAPAFAAALHGTGTRLGIVHRAALSVDAERQLVRIDELLAKLIKNQPTVDVAWREVRHLASEAAKAMGQENTSWHGLVRRYKDDLP